MKYQITGTTMPVLELTLDPGDKIIAESGELSWMGAGMQLKTSMAGGASGGGGLFGAEDIHRLSGIGGGDEILVTRALEMLANDFDVDGFVIDDHEFGIKGIGVFGRIFCFRERG